MKKFTVVNSSKETIELPALDLNYARKKGESWTEIMLNAIRVTENPNAPWTHARNAEHLLLKIAHYLEANHPSGVCR